MHERGNPSGGEPTLRAFYKTLLDEIGDLAGLKKLQGLTHVVAFAASLFFARVRIYKLMAMAMAMAMIRGGLIAFLLLLLRPKPELSAASEEKELCNLVSLQMGVGNGEDGLAVLQVSDF